MDTALMKGGVMNEKLKRWLVFRPYERHSLVLMVGGLVYILVGVTFLVAELSSSKADALAIALRWFPMDFWAAAFIAGGLLAVVSSRWPSFHDSWGYIVLTGLSSGWSAMYLMGIIVGPSRLVNISYSLVWGLLAFMWWAISGLTNPRRRTPYEPN